MDRRGLDQDGKLASPGLARDGRADVPTLAGSLELNSEWENFFACYAKVLWKRESRPHFGLILANT